MIKTRYFKCVNNGPLTVHDSPKANHLVVGKVYTGEQGTSTQHVKIDVSDTEVCEYWLARFTEVPCLNPHVHRDIIIAYADGFKIQYLKTSTSNTIVRTYWVDTTTPTFSKDRIYRVKPEIDEALLKAQSRLEELDRERDVLVSVVKELSK